MKLEACLTVLTSACHWSLSWASWIQSTLSHPIFLRSSLILSPYLYLPSGLLIHRKERRKHLSVAVPLGFSSHGIWFYVSMVFNLYMEKSEAYAPTFAGNRAVTESKTSCLASRLVLEYFILWQFLYTIMHFCFLIAVDWRFRGAQCLHHQGDYPDDESSTQVAIFIE